MQHRLEILTAFRQVEEDHRLVGQVGEVDDAGLGKRVVARQCHIGPCHAEHLGRDSGAQPQVIGQRDLRRAVAQCRTHRMCFGFDHIDVQFGVLFAELGDESGKDERTEGDKARQPHPSANLIDVAAGAVEHFVEVIQ